MEQLLACGSDQSRPSSSSSRYGATLQKRAIVSAPWRASRSLQTPRQLWLPVWHHHILLMTETFLFSLCSSPLPSDMAADASSPWNGKARRRPDPSYSQICSLIGRNRWALVEEREARVATASVSDNCLGQHGRVERLCQSRRGYGASGLLFSGRWY